MLGNHHPLSRICLEIMLRWFLRVSFCRLSESIIVFSISLHGIFYFPWHRHQIEGTNGFYCFFRKTQGKWGERNYPSFETAEVVSSPVHFNRKPDALPHDHLAQLKLEGA